MPASAFNIASLNPDLWLDASDSSTITASGSPAKVSQWNSKGSITTNFAQATAAAQPTTGATTRNGLNVIDFDGGDYLTSNLTNDWKFMHDGTVYMAFAVITVGTTSDPNAIYAWMGNNAGTSTVSGILLSYEDRVVAATNNAARVILTRSASGTFVVDNSTRDTWTPNQWNVVSHLMSPSSSIFLDRNAVKVNGNFEYRSNTSSGAVSSANPSHALQVGASGNNALPMTGSLAEVIVVSGTNATAANRDNVIGYLNTKWAVY